MENNWLVQKAAQMQSHAYVNVAKSFCKALKGVYGPTWFFLHSVRSIDCALINNKDLILAGWAEHLQSQLNKAHATNPG